MVTPENYVDNGAFFGADIRFGLSTDNKPTDCGNGTFYIMIDKVGSGENFVACYDAENGVWYPEESGGNDET